MGENEEDVIFWYKCACFCYSCKFAQKHSDLSCLPNLVDVICKLHELSMYKSDHTKFAEKKQMVGIYDGNEAVFKVHFGVNPWLIEPFMENLNLFHVENQSAIDIAYQVYFALEWIHWNTIDCFINS